MHANQSILDAAYDRAQLIRFAPERTLSINVEAILDMREGQTGGELAAHYLRVIDNTIAKSCYATAEPADRLAYETGLLRSYLREACNLIALAVEEPGTL